MPPLAPLRAAARSPSTALVRRQPNLKFPLSFRPSSRQFSQSKSVKGSGGHGSHYDAPSGWLFGVKPGEKYQKEGWEGIWYWGFYGSFAVAIVAYAFKPDTRYALLKGWPFAGFSQADYRLAFRHGRSKRHDDGWKPRASCRTPPRSPRSRAPTEEGALGREPAKTAWSVHMTADDM